MLLHLLSRSLIDGGRTSCSPSRMPRFSLDAPAMQHVLSTLVEEDDCCACQAADSGENSKSNHCGDFLIRGCASP
jgi:hypothetical protein